MCGSKNKNWMLYSEPNEKILMGMEYEFFTDVPLVTPQEEQLFKMDGWHFEFEVISNHLGRNLYGFELKTPIFSLNKWKELSPPIFNSIRKHRNSHHAGIHVNVSRNDYNWTQFLDVDRFIKTRGVYWKMKRLSGRKDFYYCDMNLGHGSYNAALTSRKRHAYEFRIFAATLENVDVSIETTHLLFNNRLQTWGDFVEKATSDIRYENLAKKLQRLELNV